MTDESRPAVPGYVQEHLLMTENELAVLTAELELLADKGGYRLGQVFVERIDQVPAAFEALFELIERDRPEAVLVPSALHLAVLGLPRRIAHHLRAVTGTRVLFANSPEPAEPASPPHTMAGSAT